MDLFDRILQSRGINLDSDFLNPDYEKNKHDPMLLPDMGKALRRLKLAYQKQEKITIYGDYDVDGVTSAELIFEGLSRFGFENVEVFIPNRFTDGFGLNSKSIETIVKNGSSLIITVDCGSVNVQEVDRANKLGCDVIITDHHKVGEIYPDAIAVINPKRPDSKYPFRDLAGVGVAFKLIQAMQTVFDGMPDGQEKWMLDLVALGTVCDSVSLVDENRANVFWGLKVFPKTRRYGLRSLMNVSGMNSNKINSTSLGFVLGPRINAAGRLDTARHAFDLLNSNSSTEALRLAKILDTLNLDRKKKQNYFFAEASEMAKEYLDDPVLVLSSPDWNQGIAGIVASKILDQYKKPTFIMQEVGENTKGSARSYGDFDITAAISDNSDLILKGGGHKMAAGVTLPTENVDLFRQGINASYLNSKLELFDQQKFLLPIADVVAGLDEITEELVSLIDQLEPFGEGNRRPVICSKNLKVINTRRMGDRSQHLKLILRDDNSSQSRSFVAFNAPENFFVSIGENVSVWYQPEINEWNGQISVESLLLNIETE